MKTRLAPLVVALGMGVLLLLPFASARATARDGRSAGGFPPPVTLGPPSRAPIMTKGQALAVAEHEFGTVVFSRGFSVAFGSFTDPGHSQRGADGSLHPLGTRDVWQFTVTGLDIPHTCAVYLRGPSNCPRDAHTLTVLVDDGSGKLLEGIAF